MTDLALHIPGARLTTDETPTIEQSQNQRGAINVGKTERLLSLAAGGALIFYGLTNRKAGPLSLALLGGGLLFRGATGHCTLYGALDVNTARPDERGIEVDSAITIDKSPETLFAFWRSFDNLPLIMTHLKSVTVTDNLHSRWVVKAPAGQTVAWDAEIIAEKTNELISWRSLANADVDNAGSVRFLPAPGGRGTEVKVSLEYNPPGGVIGGAVAKLFGEEPQMQIDGDLRRFKQLMEAGEIATTEGQPSGRKK